MSDEQPETVTLDYTNHRGVRGFYTVTPERFFFGTCAWHPEAQWLMVGYCHERKATRTFALKDVNAWMPPFP